MSNSRYRKTQAAQRLPRLSPSIMRAGAILADEINQEQAEAARAQARAALFDVPRLTLAQKLRALLAGFILAPMGRLALAALAAAFALALAMLAAGCSTDPTARAIIQRQAEYWEQDRRPILPDADFMALPEGQRPYFLPESLAKARRFAMKQAKDYARD